MQLLRWMLLSMWVLAPLCQLTEGDVAGSPSTTSTPCSPLDIAFAFDILVDAAQFEAMKPFAAQLVQGFVPSVGQSAGQIR